MDNISYKAGPKCPNHAVPLQLTNDKGVGICPISGCYFNYSYSENEGSSEVKTDKYGKLYLEPIVKQVDGGTGG